LEGRAYRQAIGLMDLSIFQPDPRTLIVAHDDLLRRMVSNHASPQAGEMSRRLEAVADRPDLYAVVLAERLRPLLQLGLMQAALPPPLKRLRYAPELVDSVEAQATVTGEGRMSITVRARDEAAAVQLEQIVDQALAFAREKVLWGLPHTENSRDPVQQAATKYSQRITDRMLKLVRPVRKGNTLTLATKTGPNALLQTAQIGMVASFLLPAVQAAREAARRAGPTNNMKLIALAMHNYAMVYRTFPPAYKANAGGKPLLSWRVLILPFLEGQNGLFEQFHLDEPWDSPHNKSLIARMPAIYKAPDSKVWGQGKTNYLTVRGPRSVFSGGQGAQFAQITRGLSNVIMTVDAPDESAVIWTKPDDFQYDPTDPAKGLMGLRSGGFYAGLVDGSVRFVSANIDRRVLAELFTRDTGEAARPGEK
jgi:hypothetical protein